MRQRIPREKMIPTLEIVFRKMMKYECKFLMPFTSILSVCLFVSFRPYCRNLCRFQNKRNRSIHLNFSVTVVFSIHLFPIIISFGFINNAHHITCIIYLITKCIDSTCFCIQQSEANHIIIALWKMDVKMKLICHIKIMDIRWKNHSW